MPVAMAVSMAAQARAAPAFRRDGGVVDERVRAAAFEPLLISRDSLGVSSGSARSTWMWSSGPISQGQFSGNAWREQVITRQPAEEKRLTVAWPMPRLAPVRT